MVPDDAAEQIRTLREDLLKARQELRQREAELETSQAMGRESTARVKETHERLLRTAADLENFRKRTLKEREEAYLYGHQNLVKELLPTVDNLERAIEHARGEGADLEGLLQGVELVLRELQSVLARVGVAQIEAEGKPFDPALHEAMGAQPSADVPPNTVTQVFQKGYRLRERMLRPARVMISSAVGNPTESESE